MRTHAVNSKPRLRWVMIITRMMHSEIDSPRSRTFCSHRHVSSSIGLCQLPFDNRRGEQPFSFALDRADVRSEPAWCAPARGIIARAPLVQREADEVLMMAALLETVPWVARAFAAEWAQPATRKPKTEALTISSV